MVALAAGVVVGLVVGIFGAGGGILAVPALVYLLDTDPGDAAAASLIIVGLTALVSLLPRLRKVAWKDGIIFAALAAAGNVLGSKLSLGLDGRVLLIAFGVLLLGVSIYMIGKARSSRPPREARSLPVTIATSSLTGLLTGLFGVGGGFIIVPALVAGLGFRMSKAVATSLLVMALMSTIGLLSRLGGDITYDMVTIGLFAAGSMIATIVGGRLTRNVSDQRLKLAFGIMVGIMGLVMIGLNV